jgi:YD repeat-containing protein
VVKNLYYDGVGRLVAEDNPYLANQTGTLTLPVAGTPQTNYAYDALDRVILVKNPDGTNKTTVFMKENITDYDENGNRHKYGIDALGRIVAVHEFNNDPHTGASEEEYITTYEYDGNDNLIQITDHVGNTFNFTYDSLSRKVRMEDPDMGLWAYDYDARGNLISQNDSRGAFITLSYDALNRVTRKNSSDVNLTFAYDAQYQGTLSNVTSLNQTRRFVYDERMRPIGVVKELLGEQFSLSFLR